MPLIKKVTMENKPNNGDVPEKEILNIEVNEECPNCKTPKTTLLERILIEGSLQNYHLMYTVVDDVFECKKCKNKWTQLVYL